MGIKVPTSAMWARKAESVCQFSHLTDSPSQLASFPGRQTRPPYLLPGRGKGLPGSLIAPSQTSSVPILLQVVPPGLRCLPWLPVTCTFLSLPSRFTTSPTPPRTTLDRSGHHSHISNALCPLLSIITQDRPASTQ